MRSLLIALLLLVLSVFHLAGQNLLPNPGFEYYLECPGDTASIVQVEDWFPSLVITDAKDRGWRAREYLHTCDPEVEPFWTETLGQGILKRRYSFDPIEQEVLTTVNWTTIQVPLQRDTIYYLEFTAVPNQVYYPPEDKWYRTRCPEASLGYKFMNDLFQDTLDRYTVLEPDLNLSRSGVLYEAGDILRIGNCYVAGGDEKYLLFGHFRHAFNHLDDRCIGEDLNPWLTHSFLMDNFKLQQLKLEICCDQTVCSRDLIDFSKFVQEYALSGVRYIWSDGQEGLVRTFEQSGSYTLEMATLCGSVFSNTIDIQVENCSARAFVPNAFSPNADGINDFFKPYFSEKLELSEFTFSIFNRWGQLLFHSRDQHATVWDGHSRGLPVTAGIYLWVLEYEFSNGRKTERIFQTGELTLIR